MDTQGMTLLLFAGSALLLGLRHGVDWDHIAAISDVTGTARSAGRALLLATAYAAGHAFVIVILGLLAVIVGIQLPDWIDEAMEPLVGVTLVVLAAWLFYSLVRDGRDGTEFRLRSRWMLLADGVRLALEWLHARLRARFMVTDSRFRVERGSSAGTASDERGVRNPYGLGMAGAVGVLHGIGVETPTQLLLFAAAAGAAGAGDGIVMVALFVLGLLISNTAIAVASISGFAGARRHPAVLRSAGAVTAVFSLALGALLLAGQAGLLPELLVAG